MDGVRALLFSIAHNDEMMLKRSDKDSALVLGINRGTMNHFAFWIFEYLKNCSILMGKNSHGPWFVRDGHVAHGAPEKGVCAQCVNDGLVLSNL